VTAAVALSLHVLVVMPSVTMFVLVRQGDDARARRRELCIQTRENRAAMLDLIDFATQPLSADPSLVSSMEERTAIITENARRQAVRAYALDRLPEIEC
jgi:hypothetical protein